MKKHYLHIDEIPSILWGPKSNKLFISVHGDQSHKEDETTQILADCAINNGYQVLSFDLAEHGDRKDSTTTCKPSECVYDLKKILEYAQRQNFEVSLFGCSLGAYFSLLAYRDLQLQRTLLLSPVINMKRIIENIMGMFSISRKFLEREGTVCTPIRTLYWDYYQYVLQHPLKWNLPTRILIGQYDQVCHFDDISIFAKKTHSDITMLSSAGHFFHTDEQLKYLGDWLNANMKP